MSNGLGKPSFLRMPTDSTPQCANTATGSTVPPRRDAARSNTLGDPIVVQSVAVHRREQADRPQAFVERALGVIDRVLARRIEHEEADEARSGLCATAIATESASPGRLAISAALSTPCLSSSATQRAPSASAESGNSQPSAVIALSIGAEAGEETRREEMNVRVA